MAKVVVSDNPQAGMQQASPVQRTLQPVADFGRSVATKRNVGIMVALAGVVVLAVLVVRAVSMR